MLSLAKEKDFNRLDVARSDLTSLDAFNFDGKEISEDFNNYQNAISETIEINIKLLDELPPLKYLKKSEIKAHLRKILKKDLEKDRAFEKGVEITKYSTDMKKYLVDYFREIFELNDKRREKLESRLFNTCRLFFNSNLPLEFLTISENSIIVQKVFIDIFEKMIRKERIQLIVNRNNRKKFNLTCEHHNYWINPFSTRLVEINKIWTKLFWYVDFCSSKTLDDIFKIKKIKADCVNLSVLKEYLNKLYVLTQEVELLTEKHSEFSPDEAIEDNNEAVALIKIMDLISN